MSYVELKSTSFRLSAGVFRLGRSGHVHIVSIVSILSRIRALLSFLGDSWGILGDFRPVTHSNI